MIAPLPPIRFAAPRIAPHPWPYSPLLELPGGDLRNYDCGRILTAQQFVLAVGLSPQHYVAVVRAPGVGPVGKILEQLVGFLCAHGACVIRVQLRAPMVWFTDNFTEFNWQACLIYFTRIYLAVDPTDPPWVPPNIWPLVPVAALARAGQQHWEQVQRILDGLAATDPELILRLGTSLAVMAQRWEFYIARQIVLSQRAGEYDADDFDAVVQCDHFLYRLLTQYEPAYELLPVTLARLL